VQRLGAQKLICIKPRVSPQAHPAVVHSRVIPILPLGRPQSRRNPGLAVRLLGDLRRAQQVREALERAAREELAPTGWLREVRVGDGEACVALAPGLAPAEGRRLAQTAFDTLRRLLPDTDLYVGAARGTAAH
jgi:hypothetical protein